MKTAVSIPDELFAQAEIAARELGFSRSKLIQTALEIFLRERHDEEVSRRLEQSFALNPSEVDPALQEMAEDMLRRVEFDK